MLSAVDCRDLQEQQKPTVANIIFVHRTDRNVPRGQGSFASASRHPFSHHPMNRLRCPGRDAKVIAKSGVRSLSNRSSLRQLPRPYEDYRWNAAGYHVKVEPCKEDLRIAEKAPVSCLSPPVNLQTAADRI